MTLALAADSEGNGRIDYQEFMKYFKDSLFWLKFNNELQTMYEDELQYTQLGTKVLVSGSGHHSAMATPKVM